MPYETKPYNTEIGASLQADGQVRFVVWAPRAQTLSVKILDSAAPPAPLDRDVNGYFSATVSGAGADSRYLYQFEDGTLRPDPASRYHRREYTALPR